eukprot:g32611.t1
MDDPCGRWFSFTADPRTVMVLEKGKLAEHLAGLPCVESPTYLTTILRELEDAGEASRLLKMSAVLERAKKMQLFGAHYWLGRQVEGVPPHEAPIPDAPQKNCAINRKQKGGEYWICLDLFGVRFVTADSQPGQSFSRGFLFNEETMERIYCCKAKGNIVGCSDVFRLVDVWLQQPARFGIARQKEQSI